MNRFIFTLVYFFSCHCCTASSSIPFENPSSIKVFGGGEFLYWQAAESVFDVVVENPGYQTSGLLGASNYDSIDFDYFPGMKVFLGVRPGYDFWDLIGTWTYMHAYPTTAKIAEVPFTMIIPAISTAGDNPPFASSYKALWNMVYNTWDLVLRKELSFPCKLKISPFVGVRGAYIKRNLVADYKGIAPDYNNFFDVAPATISGPIKISFFSRFWGVGLRAGADLHWLIGSSGFGSLFSGSGSILEGSFISTTYYSATDYSNLNSSISSTNHLVLQANAEMDLGFDYRYCWGKNRYFHLAVTYNFSYWWNVFNLSTYSSRERQDLFLAGPSIAASILY